MLITAFLSVFDCKVTGNLIIVSFEKFEMSCKQTHKYRDWLTHRQTYEQKSKNLKKPTLSVVNAGPLVNLYYQLYVEGVTLKVSLLPVHIR